MADLTVTQIIQESVEEEHRGSFNGVQSSMNMMMDLIKNALVTIFPKPQTFGYLIIASFTFVCLGWVLYLCMRGSQKVSGTPMYLDDPILEENVSVRIWKAILYCVIATKLGILNKLSSQISPWKWSAHSPMMENLPFYDLENQGKKKLLWSLFWPQDQKIVSFLALSFISVSLSL